VSFHLDLFIYEWEMVCGFSSAFVSVYIKYIRSKVHNGNFNSGLGGLYSAGFRTRLLFSKRLAKLSFWETCKNCVRKAFSSWLIQYSMYPIKYSIFRMYSMDPRCSAQERKKTAAVLMS